MDRIDDEMKRIDRWFDKTTKSIAKDNIKRAMKEISVGNIDNGLEIMAQVDKLQVDKFKIKRQNTQGVNLSR